MTPFKKIMKYNKLGLKSVLDWGLERDVPLFKFMDGTVGPVYRIISSYPHSTQTHHPSGIWPDTHVAVSKVGTTLHSSHNGLDDYKVFFTL